MVKNLPPMQETWVQSNVGDLGSVPGSGRSPGEGNGNPLQYSFLDNPMDRGVLSDYSPWGHKRAGFEMCKYSSFALFQDCLAIWGCLRFHLGLLEIPYKF